MLTSFARWECKCTFEGRLQHRSRFGGQQDAPGVLVEGAAFLAGHDQLPDEARAVSDVVVLVVSAQVQDVLGQQLGLRAEREFGLRKHHIREELVIVTVKPVCPHRRPTVVFVTL